MKKFFKTLSISLVGLTLLSTPFTVYGVENKKPPTISPNLKMQQRQLWSDHVSWTRSFIVSDLASLEDKDPVLQRLLKNQDDIGNSIKPYYGEEAGNALSKLLREHI
ncbi:MAG TPA: glycosyltransferase, partial [Clostridium sp.]